MLPGECKSLEFRSSVPDYLPKPVDIMKAHLDDFGSQLKAKDGIFQDFEKEIKRSLLESAQSKKQVYFFHS
ncbi:polyamine-modulated factor 1-binding protein 1-like [Arapaima gigas]